MICDGLAYADGGNRDPADDVVHLCGTHPRVGEPLGIGASASCSAVIFSPRGISCLSDDHVAKDLW